MGRPPNPSPFIRWASTRRLRQLVCVAAATFIVCGPVCQTSADQLDPHRQICGLNSLYALLSLEGHRIEFSQLQSSLASTVRGTDMASMQSAARSVGVPATIQRFRFEQLAGVSRPFIAHLYGKQVEEGVGHFVVVHEVGDSGVNIIDGTTGANRRMRKSRFLENWSGHILTLEDRSTLSRPVTYSSALLAGLLCCCVFNRTRSSQHQRRDGTCT